MKNSILNLGKALNKEQQLEISGGRIPDVSDACGFVQFRSYESQCLNMGYAYQPIWIEATSMCSVLGGGNCIDDL